jgi:UDP-glucose 4-epimerase
LVYSSEESLKRVKDITCKAATFIKCDVRDPQLMMTLFQQHSIEVTIHFTGLKAVGESCAMPLEYYDTTSKAPYYCVRQCKKINSKNRVFSSSATVYGDPMTLPLTENMPLSATNSFGRSMNRPQFYGHFLTI